MLNRTDTSSSSATHRPTANRLPAQRHVVASPYFRQSTTGVQALRPPPPPTHVVVVPKPLQCHSFDCQPLNLTVLSQRRRQRADDDNTLPQNAPLWQQYDAIETRLNAQLAELSFPAPIAAVYNPTVYARRLHCAYLERYLRGPPRVLFVGMNPGPWGMCQTGVPFGTPDVVRHWMRLDDDAGGGGVDRPAGELTDKYPVLGMRSKRTEVSGRRFWQVVQDLFGVDAEAFFAQCFVVNLCPLALFEARGRNVTPPELRGELRARLERLCAAALLELVGLWPADTVRLVCIGGYVDRVVRAALSKQQQDDAGSASPVARPAELLCLRHPSPRATGNTEWVREARDWFRAYGIGGPAAELS